VTGPASDDPRVHSTRGAIEEPPDKASLAGSVADARDAVATERDVAAAGRDRAAFLRDREAELDDAADALEQTGPSVAAEPQRTAYSRERAMSDRVEAQLDRERAVSDRAAAAHDREASRTLMSAVAGSGVADRTTMTAHEDHLWETSIDLLATAGHDGALTRLSASWAPALGYADSELIGRPYLELVHPDDREQTGASVAAMLGGAAPVNFENRCRAKDGSYRSFVWSARTSSDPPAIYFVVRDVTEARSGARELNATLELLREGFENAPVGMTVTNAAGTSVLRVNRAMVQLTGRREDELLACQSFAELTHPDERQDARATFARLASGELEYDEHEERLLRPDRSTVWVLRRAMPLRDAEGHTTGLFIQATDISERKRRAAVEEVSWIGRIRDAIDHDRLVLYAQPIIALATREVVQQELLLRMLDAQGELIPPRDFLGTAEKHGLIEELDAWVISQAVKLAARGEPVEVNLSGVSIGSPRILEHIERELGNHGVDPGKLVLEITEAAMMENIGRGERFAERVTALGCRFALDEFGTGFGEFIYLVRLSAKYLKIDIDFVRNLSHNEVDQQAVKGIVALATGFGQQTIAAGVEDEETLVLLGALGVDYAQGFHIGHPAATNGFSSGHTTADTFQIARAS
jgi:PAS domain S-box-containing protein